MAGKKRISIFHFTVYLGGNHVPESSFRAQSFPERGLVGPCCSADHSPPRSTISKSKRQGKPTRKTFPFDSRLVSQRRWEQERLAHTLLMTNEGRASLVWREEAEEAPALSYLWGEERMGRDINSKTRSVCSHQLTGKTPPPPPIFQNLS